MPRPGRAFCQTPFSSPSSTSHRNPIYLVQLLDEVPEVVQAALLDLQQVLVQRSLQQLVQPGLLGHKHLHHRAECLTVLRVKLHRSKNGDEIRNVNVGARAHTWEETTTELFMLKLGDSTLKALTIRDKISFENLV